MQVDIDELAGTFAYALFRQRWERKRSQLSFHDDQGWDGHIELVKSLKTQRVRQLAAGRFDDELLGAAQSILGRTFPGHDVEMSMREKLAIALAQAQVDTATHELEACSGSAVSEPLSEPVRRLKRQELNDALPGETLRELFEVYAAARLASKQRREDGIEQDRMVVGIFADFVGEKRSAGSVTFAVAKEFVDVLSFLPTRVRQRTELRGLTVRQAIEHGGLAGLPTLSLITQQRYISNLSPFFTWLKSDKGGRRLKENPLDGLHHDVKNLRRLRSRPSFSTAEISLIINSPLFRGFAGDKREYQPGNMQIDDWRKWIPLVCLFTGARIGEVAQLRLDDVGTAHGTHFVEFPEDEKEGLRTKSKNCRLVPLHSQLAAIGFLRFVERMRKEATQTDNPRLFPQIEPDARGQIGAKPGRWWRDYLDRIGLDKAGLGAHSFRHTIADQLRSAGFLDAHFGPLILGHSAPSVTAGYGSMTQGTLEVRRQMIEAVSFIPIERGWVVEGGNPVDFSVLYAH